MNEETPKELEFDLEQEQREQEQIDRFHRERKEKEERSKNQIFEKCGFFYESPAFKIDAPQDILPELANIMKGKHIYADFNFKEDISGEVTDVMATDGDILIEVRKDDGEIMTLERNWPPGFFPDDFLQPEMRVIFPREGYTRAVVLIPSDEMAEIFKRFAEDLKTKEH